MNTSIKSMVRNFLPSLVLVAGALAASAHGQTLHQQVKVAIPFAFQDGSAHLNAGVYTVGLQSGNILLIHSSRGPGSAFSIVNVNEMGKAATQGKLVFHKYGERYFLTSVSMTGSIWRLDCPKSKAEKNLQRELQMASDKQVPDGTEVALLELAH